MLFHPKRAALAVSVSNFTRAECGPDFGEVTGKWPAALQVTLAPNVCFWRLVIPVAPKSFF